jgi:glycine betaine transporter
VTLGLGTLQIVAGLGFVAGIERSNRVLTVVVVVLTIGFLFSAVAGVDRESSGSPTSTRCWRSP